MNNIKLNKVNFYNFKLDNYKNFLYDFNKEIRSKLDVKLYINELKEMKTERESVIKQVHYNDSIHSQR